jgi:hypothetical protein
MEKITYYELHKLHSLPTIVRVIKSQRMKWVTHATSMARNMKCIQKKKKDCLGDVRIDGRIISKQILRERRCRNVVWNELFQDRVQWWVGDVNTAIDLQVP